MEILLTPLPLAVLYVLTLTGTAALAYFLGRLPKRGEFEDLRREVRDLRLELAKSQQKSGR